MFFERIHLNKYYKLQYDPVIEVTYPDIFESGNPIKPCVIVVAGGCYYGPAMLEGDPIIVSFMKQGYIGVRLVYSGMVTNKKINNDTLLYPVPQLELVAAIDYLKKNAKKYCIDVNKMTAIGCSAGGHLVVSVFEYLSEYTKPLNLKPKDVKICALGLVYPLLDLATHKGSFENLIKSNEKYKKKFNLTINVPKDFPPTFVWAGKDDAEVPCKLNTLSIIKSFKKLGIPYKANIYDHARHALSSCDRNAIFKEEEFKEYDHVKNWYIDCDNFFRKIFDIKCK